MQHEQQHGKAAGPGMLAVLLVPTCLECLLCLLCVLRVLRVLASGIVHYTLKLATPPQATAS
jgi:hypothetical protein